MKTILGRTETRTRDRIHYQTMRTVRDISRDDRARIATCSLRTLTDRLKGNYSIDTGLHHRGLTLYDQFEMVAAWCNNHVGYMAYYITLQ